MMGASLMHDQVYVEPLAQARVPVRMRDPNETVATTYVLSNANLERSVTRWASLLHQTTSIVGESPLYR